MKNDKNSIDSLVALRFTMNSKGGNTMSFEAFSKEEVQTIVNHTLECMSKENLDEQVQKFGNQAGTG